MAEMRIIPDLGIAPVSRGRTKWEILNARAAELRRALAEQENYILGLSLTECNLECGGCGEMLATEKDFAAHFIVSDEHYLNLGYCPVEGPTR